MFENFLSGSLSCLFVEVWATFFLKLWIIYLKKYVQFLSESSRNFFQEILTHHHEKFEQFKIIGLRNLSLQEPSRDV